MRAGLPRSGSLAARGLNTRSHITLTVTLARLLVLRPQSLPTFSRLSLRKFRNFLLKGSLFGKPTLTLSSELFSENQFPDYLGTFPIHLPHFRNFRNFCLDGKRAKSRDKFATTVPGYGILPSNSDESKKILAQSKVYLDNTSSK